MTETSATVSGGLSKPTMIVGASITAAMLGAMGFAAIHIPGALSSPGASAPAAPPNAVYAPAAPVDEEPDPDSSTTEEPAEQADVDDSADVSDEEQAEDDSVSESDDSPDRDSDRNGDSWLRESEAEILDSDTVYHVEEGDTLASISDEVGISVDMLAHYNEISNVNMIYKRSSLVIPYSEVNVPADFADQ